MFSLGFFERKRRGHLKVLWCDSCNTNDDKRVIWVCQELRYSLLLLSNFSWNDCQKKIRVTKGKKHLYYCWECFEYLSATSFSLSFPLIQVQYLINLMCDRRHFLFDYFLFKYLSLSVSLQIFLLSGFSSSSCLSGSLFFCVWNLFGSNTHSVRLFYSLQVIFRERKSMCT